MYLSHGVKPTKKKYQEGLVGGKICRIRGTKDSETIRKRRPKRRREVREGWGSTSRPGGGKEGGKKAPANDGRGGGEGSSTSLRVNGTVGGFERGDTLCRQNTLKRWGGGGGCLGVHLHRKGGVICEKKGSKAKNFPRKTNLYLKPVKTKWIIKGGPPRVKKASQNQGGKGSPRCRRGGSGPRKKEKHF